MGSELKVSNSVIFQRNMQKKLIGGQHRQAGIFRRFSHLQYYVAAQYLGSKAKFKKTLDRLFSSDHNYFILFLYVIIMFFRQFAFAVFDDRNVRYSKSNSLLI